MFEKKEINLAVVEFKSIAKGIYVTDAMLKAANVNLVMSSSLCPGKYLTIVEGETSAVENSLKVADEIGKKHVFSSEIINSINPKVLEAIYGKLDDKIKGSIAIIESMHIASLIRSADEVADAVDIEFTDFRLARGCGVNSFYIYSGELSSVHEGSRVASQYLISNGALLAARVISGPDPEIWKWIKTSMCRC
ncbi:MAG: BMC domain-containing protein [Actinomycetota bacterium]|nr:BMC domain-containing protein [Actinomycetota bacterium]